jgi:hypothetical protein
VFLLIPEWERNAQMALHDDERLLAAVAAVLGETIALVRHRGFHIDSRLGGSERQLAGSRFRRATDDGDDALDLAAYGIDWDAGDDSRLQRRARRLNGRWLRRRVA